MDDLTAAADAVTAVAGGPGRPLVVVSPRGVLGNPSDPTRLDEASVVGDAVLVSLGRGHVRWLLDDCALGTVDERSAVLAASRLTLDLAPFGGGPVVVQHWTDAELVVTWDPELAQQLGATRGALVQATP